MYNGADIAVNSSSRDVRYIYDGTFEGFLCCVFKSIRGHEMPISIAAEDAAVLSFFDSVHIPTDFEQADIVKDAIEKKISPLCLEMANLAFLSCLEERELHILKYLKMGFKFGARVDDMLANATVSTIANSVRGICNEAHLLSGFVRFSDYDGVLVSVIEPVNRVLFRMSDHFCDRFNTERFIIYDKTHGEALVYHDGEGSIVPAKEINLPAPGADELHFRALWKRFYDTIGIKERFNPVCRRSLMPMRFWKNMTEFSGADGLMPGEKPKLSEPAPALTE